MLNENDRAYITQLASENAEVAYIVHLLEEDHREMLSMVSHEIRNPLTLINSTLQLIEQAHPEAKDFRFWTAMQNDIRELRLLLEDLSAYNNASGLQLRTLDLHRLADDVIHSFLPELHTRGIRLEVPADLPSSESPLRIHGDPVKLRQVLVNLLKNAMEALQDQDNGVIRIDLLHSEATVSLTITDNGCGILPEHLEDIFLPFQTSKPSGTGLGLPLSRRILRAHGGDLTVTCGQHLTTFVMTLPVAII